MIMLLKLNTPVFLLILCIFATIESSSLMATVTRRGSADDPFASTIGVQTEELFHCANDSMTIPIEQLCDGRVDCLDGSDELSVHCEQIRCPNYLFTCAYGACINRNLVCNGNSDCRDNSDESLTACRTSNSKWNCQRGEFACYNGQCIDENLQCDGKVDCSDSSDESREGCRVFRCPLYLFRCDYGACIRKSKICDGRKDCLDNSDETTWQCNSSNKPFHSPNDCLLPHPPLDGSWSLPNGQNLDQQPGSYVSDGTIIMEKCQEESYLDSNNKYLICYNGKWSRAVGTCNKMCPPLVNTTKLIVQSCTIGDETITCSERSKVGAVARVKCVDYYSDPALSSYPFIHCRANGIWDQSNCSPQCNRSYSMILSSMAGRNNNTNTNTNIDSVTSTTNLHPWHVAVYERVTHTRRISQELMCGGSLITQSIVITSANCVSHFNGTGKNEGVFTVVAGKYYRDFEDSRDRNNAQFLAVREVFIPGSGRGRRAGNEIAVLVLDGYFVMTEYIEQVCL